MDHYRVTTREPGPLPEIGRFLSTKTHYVKADSFSSACAAAFAVAGVSEVVMEVALTRPPIEADDDEIVAAIKSWAADNNYDPEDLDEFEGYMDDSYYSWCSQMTSILSDSGIAPDLTLSLLTSADSGTIDYSMVELNQRDITYRSRGAELKHLTDDRDATGMDGLLAIATSLIDYANSLR